MLLQGCSLSIVGLSNSVIYLISVVNYCSIEDENNLQKIGQKFGTSPVGMSWDGKYMIPTQSKLFGIPSPDQPPLSF